MIAPAEQISFGRTATVELLGDLYRPRSAGPHPAIVGVSGGAWIRGHRSSLARWGHFFADNGIAFFAVDYRRADVAPAFPGNAQDVEAALNYVAENAVPLGIDGSRLGLLGASSGAHLSALVATSPAFRIPGLAALVGIYGIYDLEAHWHDVGTAVVEQMIGASPTSDPKVYAHASPATFARSSATKPPTLLVWGNNDRIVSPGQSEAFSALLIDAGFPVRAIILGGAGHMWFSTDWAHDDGSFAAQLAPDLLGFVRSCFTRDAQ